jgi:cobalt-precorrin 5A hydrolase
MTKGNAVVAITKHGTTIARRILAGMDSVEVYYPERFARGDEDALGIHTYADSVVAHVPQLFAAYDGIIGIFSLGAMVRLIAPLLKDKKTDPAVVVIDDTAEHVVSVLSGHLGGANELTHEVARVLNARPVITTASDVGQTLAVDLFGRVFGFALDGDEHVTRVSAAVVNEERIAIIQEAGERDWWPYRKPLPSHFRVYSSCAEAAAAGDAFDAALVITPRLLRAEEERRFLNPGVLYRPKVLAVGVGCNRNTPAEEIESVVCQVLRDHGWSERSVRTLATIDLKADEAGLLEACRRRNWPLVTYKAEELNTVPIPHPSDMVFRYVGAYGVSEPAARLAAGADDWLVEKVVSGNVTVSVCLWTDQNSSQSFGHSVNFDTGVQAPCTALGDAK